MPYLVGTDEAGYGPNLGPLVVSTTVWRVADTAHGDELYKRLKRAVSKSPPRSVRATRLAIADSKALYSPAQGLALLERGVLATLGLLETWPCDWHELWHSLDPASAVHLPSLPWHVDYNLLLPLAADGGELARLVPKLGRHFEAAGVQLVAIRSRAVFPEEFNTSNHANGTKSETLSKTTLALVAEALAGCQGEPALVVCDKHGARNHYQRLLQEQFPDSLVEVRAEGAARSEYRFGPADARVEVQFRVGGESFLPAALASMTSKYLREVAMRAFNDFWCTRVADLAPTAGYPGDSHRFRRAIQKTQLALGIADRILWRDR